MGALTSATMGSLMWLVRWSFCRVICRLVGDILLWARVIIKACILCKCLSVSWTLLLSLLVLALRSLAWLSTRLSIVGGLGWLVLWACATVL